MDAMHAACLSSVRIERKRDATVSTIVDGLTPSDLASIYGYPAPTLQNQTSAIVGIVVAYDYAGVEADLATYRAKYGLSACATANGCFKKVGAAAASVVTVVGENPTSVSAHPTSSSSGWAAEADADTQTVSAVCGTCKIVLAEAASDSITDLGAAVRAAVAAGATVVSASFGAPESVSQAPYESAFEPAPVKVVAAAGDSGRGAFFPASATSVVAVAGTTLNLALGSLVTESLWSQSGGGCSSVFARAAYQPMWCGSKRSIADVAAVADPADGLAFYDGGLGGWGIVGGTSIATPIVASMFALSGDTVAGSGAQELYAHSLLTYSPVIGGGSIPGLGAPLGPAAF
jgi:subtilase family serine protease